MRMRNIKLQKKMKKRQGISGVTIHLHTGEPFTCIQGSHSPAYRGVVHLHTGEYLTRTQEEKPEDPWIVSLLRRLWREERHEREKV